MIQLRRWLAHFSFALCWLWTEYRLCLCIRTLLVRCHRRHPQHSADLR